MLALLLACAAPTPTPDGAAPDDTAADTAGDPAAPDLHGTAPLAEPSAGACPDLSSDGTVTFTSAGVERTVKLIYPEGGAAGAPVLFAWHWLGGNASLITRYLDLPQWSEDNAGVVVVPSSLDTNDFEWDFWNGGTADVTLYDDVRTCLAREVGVDLGRVYSTGMSAGGVWTTALSMQRGDTLAGIFVLSGGTPAGILRYTTPASPFPALLAYGGETDTYGTGAQTVHFDEATIAFADGLKADGHPVVLCDHGQGHTIPSEAPAMLSAYLADKTFGAAPPASVEGLPEWCAVY